MNRSALLFLILCSTIMPQSGPGNFYLQTDEAFAKISLDEKPLSNGINDLLVVGDTVWLATTRGLSRTTDKGASWKNYYGTPEFGTESITALAYDKNTGTIWASTAHTREITGQRLPEGSGIRVSSDNGSTWITIPQPLDAENDTVEVYGVSSLRALPVTVAVQNIIYDIAITKNTVWIAAFAGGIRKCRIDSLLVNTSKKWDRVVLPPDRLDAVHPDSLYNFCITPVAGRFCSDNNLNYRGFSIIAVNDSIVYAGTAGGINKTTDALIADTSKNLRWEKFSHQNQTNPISGNFIVAMNYAPSTNTLWAATWKAEGSSEFYAVSSSSDGGLNWSTSLRDEKAHNFTNFSSRVIAAADNGPFRSFDGGRSWLLPVNISDSETKIKLQTTAFYSAGYNAAGNELWLGSDDGLVLNTGIGDLWPDNWKVFFASQKLESRSATYAFPNPFSPKVETCKIKYSTGGVRASVTIRIYNSGMQYIRTVIQNAERGDVIHTIDKNDPAGVIDYWDGKDDQGNTAANGVYFYTVEINGGEPQFGKIMVLQ